MITQTSNTSSGGSMKEAPLSLFLLLDPQILANPYALYHRLRIEDPVHWDPYLHTWVVTRYDDVLTVLQSFIASRTPMPEQLKALELTKLVPFAEILVRQMLFLDPPAHGRIRTLASKAFTPRRVESLRSHIQDITDTLLEVIQEKGSMDVIADLADPLPAIVTAEILGLPTSDWKLLTAWSTNFAEILGNFQHNPEGTERGLHTLEEMTEYFRLVIRERQKDPRDDLISALLAAEQEGDRLSEEEVLANSIMVMTGGQETTTNLIGNGLLTLLQHPESMEQLRANPELIPSAIEELLRYESPVQYTSRLAPDDLELGGKTIRKRQAIIAVMGAANRDPLRFPDPDKLDITRKDNRHIAFSWGAHFCFGAPLARLEAHVAFQTLLRRMPHMKLAQETVHWRANMGFRGLVDLPITF